jgi:hypothetical protein
MNISKISRIPLDIGQLSIFSDAKDKIHSQMKNMQKNIEKSKHRHLSPQKIDNDVRSRNTAFRFEHKTTSDHKNFYGQFSKKNHNYFSKQTTKREPKVDNTEHAQSSMELAPIKIALASENIDGANTSVSLLPQLKDKKQNQQKRIHKQLSSLEPIENSKAARSLSQLLAMSAQNTGLPSREQQSLMNSQYQNLPVKTSKKPTANFVELNR